MVLIDTNIVSELCRPAPNSGVLEWARSITEISISAVSIEEIWFGLSFKPNARVQSWFDAFMSGSCKVLPVTAEIGQGAGRLRGELQSKGETRTQANMLIASTARHHQLTLVTRNDRDFGGCGIALLNPFT